MAKLVRHRRHTTYDEAFENSFEYWCLRADTTPREIRFLAEFNTDARANLLSLVELAEKDALPYRKRVHKRGA